MRKRRGAAVRLRLPGPGHRARRGDVAVERRQQLESPRLLGGRQDRQCGQGRNGEPEVYGAVASCRRVGAPGGAGKRGRLGGARGERHVLHALRRTRDVGRGGQGGEGIVAAVLEALNNLKGERRLLGVGILALTLIVALLMAWRLPMRRNVGDPQAWGIPQQQYDENYAPAEAPLEAPPETAREPEGEPSGAASGSASGAVSGPPPQEATREPTVSSDTGSTSPAASGAEEDIVAEGSDVAASSPDRERLRRIRHLRRISQRRSPSEWRGG